MCKKIMYELGKRKILVVATSKNIENLKKYFKEVYVNEVKYNCSISRLDSTITMESGAVVKLVASAGDGLRGEYANYVIVDSEYSMKNKIEEIARLQYVLRLNKPMNDPIIIDFSNTPFPDTLLIDKEPKIDCLLN